MGIPICSGMGATNFIFKARTDFISVTRSGNTETVLLNGGQHGSMTTSHGLTPQIINTTQHHIDNHPDRQMDTTKCIFSLLCTNNEFAVKQVN